MALKEDSIIYKIRVKTERAKKHIGDIETALNAVSPNPKAIAFFIDAQGKLSGPGPYRKLPIDVVATAGDAIHNLRSALDHLAWQLVFANQRDITKIGKCGFPIAETPEKFEPLRSQMAGMCSEAQELIEGLQPYQEKGLKALWAIHNLDIIDKHRNLFRLGHQNLLAGEHFSGMFGSRTDEPAEFVAILASDSDSEYQSAGQPSFMQSHVAEAKPLIPTLHDLLSVTEDLIEGFRPFLK